jgi:hypothetical protein
MRPIEETAYGLWPIARAQDAKHAAATAYELSRNPSLDLLHVKATRSLWPTPLSAPTSEASHGQVSGQWRRSMAQAMPAMWPTPRANEGTGDKIPPGRQGGLALKQAVHLWPTPCSSDDRDRGRWEDPAIQRRVTMGKQVMLSMLAQGSGAAIDGPSEQTEKRGALNPQFVSWLMGFPPEWESCAPTAMPSSRKSRQKS